MLLDLEEDKKAKVKTINNNLIDNSSLVNKSILEEELEYNSSNNEVKCNKNYI